MSQIYGSERADVGELPSSKLGIGSPADKLYTAEEYKTMIDKKEIREYLKENLKLESYDSPGYFSQNNIVIELKLEDEVISYIEVDMTNKD